MCVTLKNNYSAEEIVNLVRNKKEKYWEKIQREMPLTLFKWASKNIPAYKDFLKQNKIDPLKIKNFSDFKKVTPVSKKGYLKYYPLEKICCDCFLKKPTVFTSTSGSTGVPFYFPRSKKLDWQCSVIKELFFENGSKGKEIPTLVVVGFGMGAWIGGLITYKAFEIMSQENNYPISIITPGINKIEIFNALKSLAPHYKQTILIGYPPFIKDIIDEAHLHGINLKHLNVRLMFAAEAFTEKFRSYVSRKAGVSNSYLDTLNIYGSADIGAMAFETPLSILVRRLAVKNKELFKEIFTSINKTPTLAQYIPLFINFEKTEDGRVLLTGDSVVPLVRYDIGDHGGVLTFGEMREKFKKHGIDLKKEAIKAGLKNHIYELPFVYVYERTDFSTTLYGAMIYPEPVREAVQDRSFESLLTGKFTMLTKYNKKINQYLEINLELKKGKKVNNSFKRQALKKVFRTLREKISEFREISDHIKDRALLKLVFWPSEHPLYFKPGTKQKWVVKEAKN